MTEPTGDRAAPAAGPTALAERALAPDLARGALLLLIALANARLYLHARPAGIYAYPLVHEPVDQVVALVHMLLVDSRAYPMFAALFGYGIVQLARGRTAAGMGPTAVRKLIRRRGWWMIAIGLAHGVLLFSADIIGAYGLLAVAGAGLILRARDRTLLLLVGAWLLLAVAGTLPGPSSGGDSDAGFLASLTETDPVAAIGLRAVEWVVGGLLAQALLTLVAPVLIGVWAARRRLLDDPEHHRRLLAGTAAGGLGMAVAGGLPKALMVAGWWPDPAAGLSGLADTLHNLTGYAGGVGYAALAGLVAARLGDRDRRSPVVAALVAAGQRSMTCYLAQSVVFVAVLAAYGGGLGSRLSVTATALLAVTTWLATMAAAEVMRRRSYRGPAEILLRRLTYR